MNKQKMVGAETEVDIKKTQTVRHESEHDLTHFERCLFIYFYIFFFDVFFFSSGIPPPPPKKKRREKRRSKWNRRQPVLTAVCCYVTKISVVKER